MHDDTAGNQSEPADVPETTQAAHTTAATSTSDTPVRVAQKGKVTRRSGSERLLGLDDPQPELTERPLARKRRTPKSKPVTYLLEDGGAWDQDETPVGHALAVELGAK